MPELDAPFAVLGFPCKDFHRKLDHLTVSYCSRALERPVSSVDSIPLSGRFWPAGARRGHNGKRLARHDPHLPVVTGSYRASFCTVSMPISAIFLSQLRQ